MALQAIRTRLHEVIFGTDTPAGRWFDIVLIYAIVLSVFAVVLDSVPSLSLHYHEELLIVEWVFTGLFTVEYLVRIWIAPRPWHYIRSFYGLVDLVAILPSYIGLFISGASYLLILRLLRVLRIFRVLKLMRYLTEANILMRAIYTSRRKVFIFFFGVLVLATIFGSLMFLVEGPEHGFTSIPVSIYWTIVTITTVGYGDITPQTWIGQVIASLAMLTGYSIIAVPTGIITAELTQEMARDRVGRRCKNCDRAGHDADAAHCKYCGAKFVD